MDPTNTDLPVENRNPTVLEIQGEEEREEREEEREREREREREEEGEAQRSGWSRLPRRRRRFGGKRVTE